MNRKHYVVDRVPSNMLAPGEKGPVWYCHMEGYPNVPVFGSVGTKRVAETVCRTRNLDGKVHYT